MKLSTNMRGALLMTVAMVTFTINDTMSKAVSAELNTGQLMLVRGLFATLLITLVAWQQGVLRHARRMLHPIIALRLFGEVGGAVTFLVALAHLPLANVSAVLQALPLAVTLGAALVFKEPVGWRRWIAILVGFAGVMIIVRPGAAGFSVYSIAALACVAFCMVRDLSTKKVPADVPSVLVSVATAAAVTIAGAVLTPFFGGWKTPSTQSVGLMACAAVLLIIGYQCIILSMRTGDISFVAPFRYTALLWAIALGFLAFGELPDLAMVVGSTVIVASGLYTLYRERIRGAERPAAESTNPGMGADGL